MSSVSWHSELQSKFINVTLGQYAGPQKMVQRKS